MRLVWSKPIPRAQGLGQAHSYRRVSRTSWPVSAVRCPLLDGDASLEYICWEWEQASGAQTYRETPADVIRLAEHEHPASEFVDKATGEPFLGEFFGGIEQGGG